MLRAIHTAVRRGRSSQQPLNWMLVIALLFVTLSPIFFFAFQALACPEVSVAPAAPSAWAHLSAVGAFASPALPVGGGPAFVFFAGVEGTGHHFYKALTERCEALQRCRPSKVGPLAWQGAAALFANKPRARAAIARAARAAAAEEVASARLAGLAAETFPLLVLNTLGRTTNDEALALLDEADRAWTQGVGMLSYPNWWASPNKALQMPELPLAAAAARAARAPLRVVVQTRDARAVVRSVCEKRKFGRQNGGCAVEVAMLVAGAHALASQLDALGGDALDAVPADGVPAGGAPPPLDVAVAHFPMEGFAAERGGGGGGSRGARRVDARVAQRFGAFLGLEDIATQLVEAALASAAGGSSSRLGEQLSEEDHAALAEPLERAQAEIVRAASRLAAARNPLR